MTSKLPLFRPVDPARNVQLHAIALVITEACNFRCCMCDYWKLENPTAMPVSMAEALQPLVAAAKPRSITITGGEPLMHPEWPRIAALYAPIAPVRLCTSGLLLAKYLEDVDKHVSRLLVSIDGATDETFFAVRGVKNVSRIWKALSAIKDRNPEVRIDVKMTIQKRNFEETLAFVELARAAGFVDGVGFGMPDFSLQAFALPTAERDDYQRTVLLENDELDRFSAIVDEFYSRYSQLVESGYIFEGDLRRYLQRFQAMSRRQAHPDIRRCSIPNYNMAVYPDGQIRGCFFLQSDYTVDKLLAAGISGIESVLRGRRGFDSTSVRNCRGCDQLLFNESPYEAAPPALAAS